MKKVLKLIKLLLEGAILTIAILSIIGLLGNIMILLANNCPVLLIFAFIMIALVVVGKMLGME